MMTFTQLLILQIIAHVLADFTFQSDLWARVKRIYGFKSWIMFWHVLIVFLLSWLFSFQLRFIFTSLSITAIHLLIDSLKVRMGNFKIGKVKPFQKFSFFIDQLMHIIIIWVSITFYMQYYPTDPYLSKKLLAVFTEHHLIILLGYLLCLKPTNIAIREIFKIYNIKLQKQPKQENNQINAINQQNLDNQLNTNNLQNTINQQNEDLFNAGKLIGNIERVISLTLLLMGQYEAIGFIIAGKSILRYEGQKTSKTEYVLIGTLLSFGIAILIGIAIIKLKI
jgi:hypothetical protein